MLHINYKDSRPIYEQIKEGMKKLIISGMLADGDKLPSVRELAAQLTINPNTIQRAYAELESEGYIYSVAGKGSFAKAQQEQNEANLHALLERLDGVLDELAFMGIKAETVIEHIKGREKN
ncbi:MAG: GntR family transcriptional regulator [Firmicutes bacterium]|nr:GntR family transcriptional regulator [Bacillota bacterium]